MRNVLHKFKADRSGNFAMMTAILAVPILAAAGMSIDISRVLSQKAVFAAAADAAAVGALSTQSVGVIAAVNTSQNGEITIGEADAQKLFNGQLPASLKSELSSVSITLTKTGSTVKSNVKYTFTMPTTFAGLVNLKQISATGTASAVYDTGSFMSFYMLLDNTPSMGVGATTTDINTMVRNTSDSCAFACHDVNNANSYYSLAKSLGVQMRIDTVRQATQQLTQTAKSTARYSNQFQMAVYTFGNSTSTMGLTNVAPLSSDMNAVNSAAAGVDLMTIPYSGYNNDMSTDLDSTIKSLGAAITTVGDGSSASTPQPVIFFVSDGVNDAAKGSACTKATTNGTRCQEPIDYANDCTAIKTRGIKIAVLYTTYLPLPTNSWYNTWIAPFQSQIATNMQACASPGLYFEVSPSQGIADAMNALFQKVISMPRLAS